MLRNVIATYAVLSLLTSIPILASAETKVKQTAHFAVYEYPPLYHTSIDGHFSGTLGETIKQICHKGQLNCQSQMYPIARAYELVISGNADISISGTHPRFDSCCTASDWNYPWSAGLFTLNNNKQIPQSENDFTGQSLVVVRGWRSQYRFIPNFDQLVADKKINVYYANSNYSAIKMLESNRADLLWGSVDFLWYLDKLNLAHKIQYSERLKIPIVLWVNKNRPDVLEGLNRGYANLLASEQLDDQNLLRQDIMADVYQDAEMKKSQ